VMLMGAAINPFFGRIAALRGIPNYVFIVAPK
jgi:hypothetical protein